MAVALFRRREVLLPTFWGWTVLLAAVALAGLCALHGVYRFLAVNDPADARVLVVEGWLGRQELDEAIAAFRKGRYERIVTTGGPLHSWSESSPDLTYAHKAAAYLKRHGAVPISAAPSPPTHQDRTYNSAIMVREWARGSGIEIKKIDVVSRGPHTRRSRVLYEAAFGPDVQVGVLAIAPQDYSEARWWRTSTGAREVAEQALGFLWVKLFFSPLRQAPVRASDRDEDLEPAANFRFEVGQARRIQELDRGRVQLSDHASTQLDEGRPPRSCANTFAADVSPFTESCALFAGMKVL
jgi:hypothetical protein